MATLNPTGAATRLLGYRTNTPGMCLHYVSAAILNGKPVLQNAATARVSAGQHPLTPNYPPIDYPGYFTGGTAWDVCIYAGNGKWAAIDAPHGHTGLQTTAEREQQLGGRYIGWSPYMSGYNLTKGTEPTDTGTTTPIPTEKELETMFGIETPGTNGKVYAWALVSDDLKAVVPITDVASATQLVHATNGKSFAIVNGTTFNNFRVSGGLAPIVIP